MKSSKIIFFRKSVQILIFIILILIIILYNLYTSQHINFKIIGIGDLNPYGGWNLLKESVTDSQYEFEGITRSTALTIAILLLAALGGRFFCGWICPVGLIQDFGAWCGTKAKRINPKYSARKSFNPLFIKYPILLCILLISIMGYGAAIAELSPWRALMNLPNLLSAWNEMKLGFLILTLVFVTAWIIPRFFCRYLCPLGAAQTLFAALSPITLRKNKNCSCCNKCLDNCPMDIKISSRDESISPECIRCMKCLNNCTAGIDIGFTLKIKNKKLESRKYAFISLFLFLIIWLGVPNICPTNSIDINVPMENLKDGVYEGEAKGFAGKIITEVTISEGKISQILIIDHHESKGWYDEVFMVLPREIIKTQRLKVDAISGATKTSNGLVKSIENAIKKAM